MGSDAQLSSKPERRPRGRPAASRAEDRLLDAGLALFEARGFDGTSVPLIAEKAGVGIGTVYRYFPTKEALFNAVFLLWKKRFNAALLASMSAQIDPHQAFQTYWARAVTWVGRHPVATRFLYLHFHGPHLDAEATAVETEYLAYVEELVTWGVELGVMKPLPPLVFVALFWGSLIGLTKYENPERGLVLDLETFDATGTALWDAVRIPEH